MLQEGGFLFDKSVGDVYKKNEERKKEKREREKEAEIKS